MLKVIAHFTHNFNLRESLTVELLRLNEFRVFNFVENIARLIHQRYILRRQALYAVADQIYNPLDFRLRQMLFRRKHEHD